MRWLRGIAWAVFALDLVILAQFGWAIVQKSGGPTAQAITLAVAFMLGCWLLGIAVLLGVSTWLGSRFGLWFGLVCAALPLSWVLGGVVASAFE